MSPHRYLAALGHQWWVVAATTVLGCFAAFGLSAVAIPQYTATATLFFAQSTSLSSNDLNQGATYTQNQMLSFARLAESPTVLQPVISALGLNTTPDEFAKVITVTTPQNTVIMDAAATDPDPVVAAHIANELTRSIAEAVSTISPLSADKTSSMNVHVIAAAATPTSPSSPDTGRNILAGGLIGLLVGALVIVLRERLDDRVRSTDVLAAVTTAPVLGTLAREKNEGKPQTPEGFGFKNREALMRMSAYLAGIEGTDKKLSLLVTSSIPGEGTPRVALGLANAFAAGGRSVLILDADIRQPGVARITGLADSAGLTSVLVNGARYQALVNTWGRDGLDVLVAGPAAAQPGGLLLSEAMAALMARLTTRYDVLVVTAAPVNSAADALAIGALVDGTVLVADSRTVSTSQLDQAVESLSLSDTAVFGVVLNGMPRQRGIRSYPATERPTIASAWHGLVDWVSARTRRRPSDDTTGTAGETDDSASTPKD